MPAKTGTAHHFAKLSNPKVARMREWYADGGISVLELAVEYGVSYNTALMAIKGKTWKEAPFPAIEDCPSCCGTGRRVSEARP